MSEPIGRELRDREKLIQQKTENLAAMESSSLFYPLRSGSKWKQDHLTSLGINFKITDEFDLCGSVFDPQMKQAWENIHAKSQSMHPQPQSYF